MPPLQAVEFCKPCLNRRHPLRKQLLLSFLSLTVVSLLLAVAVVVGTTVVVGDQAKERAKRTLERQIKRHLKYSSKEAAAIIGEKLRRLKDGVLDVSAFALRDSLQEDIILAGGSEGYPLSPAHTDLRDTEIATSTEATLDDFHRQNIPVDLSRSVWYYANEGSNTATLSAEDASTVGQTARLDLFWPTMYANSINTKAVYIGFSLPTSSRSGFRYFPGGHLSGQPGTFYPCEAGTAGNSCYDPTERPWYEQAVDDTTGISDETGFGGVILTAPYVGATGSEANWMVTITRAVYRETDSTSNQLLGVVGVDVLLDAVQELVEEINFLQSGYSILATAAEGIILAAPTRVWDRGVAVDSTTVCAAANGMCSGREWGDLLSGEVVKFSSTSFSHGGEQIEGILIATPVVPNFDSETGETDITHYIISAVPRGEIFTEAERMSTGIQNSTEKILTFTVSIAAATLVAVAAAVFALSGRITRSITKMASAARSIERDGAKTDVFGSVAATWGGGRTRIAPGGSSTAGSGTTRRTGPTMNYLLCRGEDEISTLTREFSNMITGLGKRGSAARATGLEESTVYPNNPLLTETSRAPPMASRAPSAPTVG